MLTTNGRDVIFKTMGQGATKQRGSEDLLLCLILRRKTRTDCKQRGVTKREQGNGTKANQTYARKDRFGMGSKANEIERDRRNDKDYLSGANNNKTKQWWGGIYSEERSTAA